jgi:hypothetical protein
MKIAEIPFAVLRFQYQLARFPFYLIEGQLAARLVSEAPVRLFYERSLGAVDATVGKLLGDPELQRRGTALAERSTVLGRAAKLDAAATRRREQADAKLEATQKEVVTDIDEARAATEQEAREARDTAEKRKREADEAAQKRIAAAKKQAEDVATQRRKTAEAANRADHSRIQAAEQKATKAAESKLDDARQKRGEAVRKRAQADGVEELADIEKQNRRSARASKKLISENTRQR